MPEAANAESDIPYAGESSDFWDESLFSLVMVPAASALHTLHAGLAQDVADDTTTEKGREEPGADGASPQPLSGLGELISGIFDRKTAARKFMMPDADLNDRDNLIVHEIESIPLTLASAAASRSGNEVDEATFRSLCAQQFRYILNADPRVDIVVPILGSDFQEIGSFGKYELIEMSADLKESFSGAIRVSRHDATELAAASQALRISDVSCIPGGYGDFFAISPGEEASDAMDRFFQALAIIAPGSATYAQVGFFPRGWSTNLEDPERPFIYLLREYGLRIDSMGRRAGGSIDGEALAKVIAIAEALAGSHPSVRVAAHRLVRSYEREEDEDRIIDLSIALEAILGSGFSETVHRISLRAAVLLTKAGWSGSKSTYNAMKAMYGYRSRVVHGTPGPHKQDLLKIDGTPIHASRFALAALCSLLEFVLNMESFHPDKIDDEFIFSAFDQEAADATADVEE
ncbi:HEPN domain-containing protein [Micromonospora craterilacus]|uniref:HEPN domain-containing protein n=1 Tax=Micromonospora craterilacus TaxID=1655439 RepID=UPI0011B706FD|nr:HEPN domain-containing protein [Micromonospora craterilacus]